jgi:hypothetical protein
LTAKTERSALPKFTNVLRDSGITFKHHALDTETGTTYKLNPYDHGAGLCVVDVNGDGRDDIYFLDFKGRNHLYLNRGNYKFEDVTERSGIGLGRAVCTGAAFGDYDNDGNLDVYVTTYRCGNKLFRNRGDGTFEDVTVKAGVGYKGHSSSCTWFDYNNDGLLDLLVCNVGKFTLDTISREADYFYEGEVLDLTKLVIPDRHNVGEGLILFRNNGDGTFTNVTKEAGLETKEWNGDMTVADFDQDGYLDIYVTNMFGANHLFRNRGHGTFEDVTAKALGRTSWGAVGAKFFDANGDQYPDLYVVDMHSDMWIPSTSPEKAVPTAKFDGPWGPLFGGKVISKPEETRAKTVLYGNTYFVNNGDGTFTEKSAAAGLESFLPWGIAVGDFNNHGYEDIFVASGMGYPYFYWPNALFLNRGDGTFMEKAAACGIEPPMGGTQIGKLTIHGRPCYYSSRAAAVADLNGVGKLDIVVANFNSEPYLLRNDSAQGNYIRLKLRGTRAARDAYGTRVVVKTKQRTWYRWLSCAEGYLTQSSKTMHIGLGDVKVIDRIEVYWLGQKKPQIIESPKINQVLEIVQE